jgi:hypothetical protein
VAALPLWRRRLEPGRNNVTTELPPGVKLGKDGDPRETLGTSAWPATAKKMPVYADKVENPDDDDVYHKRKEGEEIQPGDLVIDLRYDGKIFIQTEPEGRSR